MRKIREWIKQEGITQYQAARKCGIDPGHFSRLINGKRNFTAKTAWMVSKQSGIPLEKLLWTIGKKLNKD